MGNEYDREIQQLRDQLRNNEEKVFKMQQLNTELQETIAHLVERERALEARLPGDNMTELEVQLLRSLIMYPCRCAFARMPNGQPIFKDGERIRVKECSRCEAIRVADILVPSTVDTESRSTS